MFKTGRYQHILSAANSVYLRLNDISEAIDDDYLKMKAHSMYKILLQIIDNHPGKVVGSPFRDFSHLCKVYHLKYLASDEVKTPESLVTNIPCEAKKFILKHNFNVICKGGSTVKTLAMAIDENDLTNLDMILNTPVLLQKRIVGPDVRIHTVGDMSFGEIIGSNLVD
ncbi:MAG: hypothetical protein EOP45_08565, partial [Sphingobacteriaceae bacterium]